MTNNWIVETLAMRFARVNDGFAALLSMAWRLGGSPGTVAPMSPNRNDVTPDQRPQEHARRKWRGVLIRDAYWALIVAIIVLGGAKLVARVFGGL